MSNYVTYTIKKGSLHKIPLIDFVEKDFKSGINISKELGKNFT